jgi:hypothetical protein
VGYFLAVSAFQDLPVDQLAQAIQHYAAKFGVACEMFNPDQAEPSPRTDATVFAPTDGWTIVLWPEYFNIHDFPTCETLSEQLSTLVSTVNVYDGDFWTHGLFEQGRLLDQFCSQPDYFAEDPETANQMRARWQGNPDVIASRFTIPVDDIRGYLLHLSSLEEGASQSRSLFSFLKRRKPSVLDRKVKPDDDFELDNFWVFTDFWRSLGICYPDDVTEWAKLLRFASDFTKHLPYLDEL